MEQPQNPFRSGVMLVEKFIEPPGMNQSQFAQRVGWTRTRLNELIQSKRGVTADTALGLAKSLGTFTKRRMNLQAIYWGR